MKKTTFFSLLAMMLLFVSGNVWADEAWVKTEPSKLQTGDVVAIVDLTKGLVMTNSNGAGAAPAAVAITLNDDKTEVDEEVKETWQWVVTVGEEGFQFGVEGTENYLYCTNTNNGVRVGTNENNVFSIKDAFLFNNGQSRYIGPYNTQDWRCYTSINNNIKGTEIAFFKKSVSGIVVEKPHISPAGGLFTEAQEVTITSEGNTIYYTLDGTDPTNESTQYTAPFIVDTDCTVKAIAYDNDDNASSIASVEFKFPQAITTIEALCDAATDAKESVIVSFNNWICTGVTSNNAYFTDGKNGILLYQSGHGFELNDVLTGTAQLTLTLYNDCAEIMGLSSTTEGVIVTKGEGATPMQVIISDLEKDMQGNLITLEGVTYSAEAKAFIDDDDNEIIPYNKFITLPELLDGKTYNVTGVAIWYKNKGKWEIAPRTAEEFQLLTSQLAPVSAWSVEKETVDLEGTATAKFTTDSDGAVTYSSSDEAVATIDAEGNITIVSRGTTVITADVAESETYLADSKSFTLTVTEKGYTEIVFAYNDEDIVGQGVSSTGGEITATREILTFYANKAFANTTGDHIKIYGSKFEEVGEGEEKEKVLSDPSYIQLSIAEGYAITKIVLTATTDDYIKEWTDQDGATATIEGATATWEDMQNLHNSVTLTNQSTSQARIKTIAVTYINSDVITAISTPTTVKENGAIYNLAGQRLQKMQKGINIIGGKKVVLK